MSNEIRAILVDDEERATNALSMLLSLECPQVNVIDKCRNVPEAVLAINKLKPDLVFLDIEMPEYNGFDLFGFFRDIDFNVIFVSAYSEYAINAFEVSAIDYLLKPVDIDLLKAAVEKVNSKLKSSEAYQRLEILQKAFKGEVLTKIALPMSDGVVFLPVQDIVMLEADGAYTTIHKSDKTKVLVSKKLKFFELALKDNQLFFRSHRSNMINLNHLTKYNKGNNELTLDNGMIATLSRDRKTEFEQALLTIHKSL